MKITNLEHVKSVSVSSVSGGTGGGGYNFNRSKNLNINIYERVNVKKYLNTASYVVGNSAVSEADAEAYGHNSNAQGFSYTLTTPYSSAASATSFSQS